MKYDLSVLDGLENYYFTEDVKPQITVKRTPRTIETLIEKKLEMGIIDPYVVAWKAGRLTIDQNEKLGILKNNEGKYVNGYGKTVIGLERYLLEVSSVWRNKGLDLNENFIEVYNELLICDPPINFGMVNIINLIYFLSRTNWPIYDKYAHIAVKAIYMGIKPSQVYYGDIPMKTDLKNVEKIYDEYCTMLETVFGKKNIDRHIDRALWVYGHDDR